MPNPTQVSPTPEEPSPRSGGLGEGAPGSPGAGEAPIVKEYWVEEEHANYRIVWSEDGIEINIKRYPIYPYGNYIKKVLKSYYKDGNVCIEVYQVRMSWNGTGRDNFLEMCFNDYSTEAPIFLWRSEVESIESAGDVKEYVREMSEWLGNLVGEISEFMLGGWA